MRPKARAKGALGVEGDGEGACEGDQRAGLHLRPALPLSVMRERDTLPTRDVEDPSGVGREIRAVGGVKVRVNMR